MTSKNRKLMVSDEVVDLINESGKLLGRFLPKVENPMKGWEPITPPISKEELQRRMDSTAPRLTTAEVIAHLKSRP